MDCLIICLIFLWYISCFFKQVKGQRLVYKFRNLPYKYEPGITRSVYRDRFRTINTSLCDQAPGIMKDSLPLKFNSSPSVSRAFSLLAYNPVDPRHGQLLQGLLQKEVHAWVQSLSSHQPFVPRLEFIFLWEKDTTKPQNGDKMGQD